MLIGGANMTMKMLKLIYFEMKYVNDYGKEGEIEGGSTGLRL